MPPPQPTLTLVSSDISPYNLTPFVCRPRIPDVQYGHKQTAAV